MSNLYTWGNDLVAVVKDLGDKALIKIINSHRYKKGALLELPKNQLKSQQRKQKISTDLSYEADPSAAICPICNTPGFISGIECPGCGYKNEFREWLNS